MRTLPRTAPVALFTVLGLLASACGGGGQTASASSAGDNNAAAAADANIADLQTSDDVRLIEILDVESGAVTTLADTVDGDRPVLIWFWAPH